MTIEVRPVLGEGLSEDDAFELMLKSDSEAFDETAPDEVLGNVRALLELDRSYIAWDGKEAVGCGSIFSLDMSVPGGNALCAGVTWIGVKPSHRRLGGMRAMMNALHDETREAGREPIAGLWAAQPPLYGRFGYGWATSILTLTVERVHGSLSRAPSDPSLRTRMVEPPEDRQDTQGVYDAVRARRPGMPELTEVWHTRNSFDAKEGRDGGPLRTIVVEDDAGVRGYARYRFKHEWSAGYGDGTINVRELMAQDPAAEAALWRYLIDFDLSGRVEVWNLPIDTPVQLWFDQPRHHKQRRGDALYIKLIDVADALSRRTYAAPADVVLEVADETSPWNAGRWRMSVDQSGCAYTKTTDAADLTLDVSALGAAYLGGTTLDSFGAAGWIDEHTPGALHQLSTAFVHPTAPWSPFVF